MLLQPCVQTGMAGAGMLRPGSLPCRLRSNLLARQLPLQRARLLLRPLQLVLRAGQLAGGLALPRGGSRTLAARLVLQHIHFAPQPRQLLLKPQVAASQGGVVLRGALRVCRQPRLRLLPPRALHSQLSLRLLLHGPAQCRFGAGGTPGGARWRRQQGVAEGRLRARGRLAAACLRPGVLEKGSRRGPP